MPDNLTPEQRRKAMSSVRSKNTKLEKTVFARLDDLGVPYDTHVRSLPGCPDAVFSDQMVAVFIDSDFWHGWRYPTWVGKLPSDFWRTKIEKNRARDRRNFRKLRRHGWTVVRLWEHSIRADLDACIERVLDAISEERQ